MTNENTLIFLCAKRFQICHFPTFFFSVVSPLILKTIHSYSLHACTEVQIVNLETAVEIGCLLPGLRPPVSVSRK